MKFCIYFFFKWIENICRICQLFQMVTDLNYGIGMDRVVKQQSDWSPTYMYIFHWKSWNDWLPWYLGMSLNFCNILSVRSVLSNLLVISRTKTVTVSRAFRIAAPKVWNSLPPTVRSSDSITGFRRQLKTRLFDLAYNWPQPVSFSAPLTRCPRLLRFRRQLNYGALEILLIDWLGNWYPAKYQLIVSSRHFTDSPDYILCRTSENSVQLLFSFCKKKFSLFNEKIPLFCDFRIVRCCWHFECSW